MERRFGRESAFWEKMFELFLVLGREKGNCMIKRVEERGERNVQNFGGLYDF